MECGGGVGGKEEGGEGVEYEGYGGLGGGMRRTELSSWCVFVFPFLGVLRIGL